MPSKIILILDQFPYLLQGNRCLHYAATVNVCVAVHVCMCARMLSVNHLLTCLLLQTLLKRIKLGNNKETGF
jgi:hypothetical protein